MRPATLLAEDDEQQFLELYGHLLLYVNDRFGIDDEIDAYGELEQQDTGELLPIRNQLYEEDTEQLIEAFVGILLASQTMNSRLLKHGRTTNSGISSRFVILSNTQSFSIGSASGHAVRMG